MNLNRARFATRINLKSYIFGFYKPIEFVVIILFVLVRGH